MQWNRIWRFKVIVLLMTWECTLITTSHGQQSTVLGQEVASNTAFLSKVMLCCYLMSGEILLLELYLWLPNSGQNGTGKLLVLVPTLTAGWDIPLHMEKWDKATFLGTGSSVLEVRSICFPAYCSEMLSVVSQVLSADLINFLDMLQLMSKCHFSLSRIQVNVFWLPVQPS